MARFADYEPQAHGAPSPPDLATRRATHADVPALALLRAERDGIPASEAEAVFRRLLGLGAAQGACVLLACVGQAIVGYGVVEDRATPGLPAGHYLAGVVVAPAWRRRGIGARLTEARIAWLLGRAREAYYFVNERNRASIDLHAAFGFREIARDIRVPGVTFTDGVGLLFRAAIACAAPGDVAR